MSTTPAAADPIRWKILGLMLVSVFMSLMSVSIMNVALPAIQAGLGATHTDIQWVLSGYTLVFGAFLVPAGRAGDIFGRPGFFLIGLIVFLSGSVAGGLSPTPAFLVAARLVQGMGAGLMNPQLIGMIQYYFTGKERGRAFGFFGSTVGIAVAIGPVLGGFLIGLGGEDLGWQLTMFVNLPIGLIVLILGLLWFPRPLASADPVRTADGSYKISSVIRAIDPVGVALLTSAVLLFLLPFAEGKQRPWVWFLALLSLLLLTAFVRWERSYKDSGHAPMVDLDVLVVSSFRNGAALSSLYFLGITSIWVIVAMYFQQGLGYSALVAGSVGIPAALASSLSADWAGRRVMDLGRPLVVGGMLVATTGMILSILVILGEHRGMLSEWWLVATLGIVGVGQGSVISPNQTLSLADVPQNYAGSSGAVLQVGQRIGTAIGLAMITAVLFALLERVAWPVAVAGSFGIIVIIMLSATAIGVHDVRQRRAITD
ncbi:MFS transporter [Corynebacterium sp. TAE3-ERU2]|uniref:MFS transporter n=1 Tax=Corynebacterium sp. TAE3-ERU2 TaxID=2849497 RepID=UPI001C456D67|nr:MFS transporter [Corynebacterium sp. TAE3-ERU2]MBV7303087.1 MFS transporter [Corynebacterium sp. TAE3-ERU2]